MKHYEGYLIDLDGTMFRGIDEIQGAKEFVDELNERHIPHLFLTNNSSRTLEQTVEKLEGFGIDAKVEQVITASLVTAAFIKENLTSRRAFVVGQTGLINALEEAGIELTDEEAEIVVMGIDRNVTYEKITRAALNAQKGAYLLATNPDIKVPTERGFTPGNGAFVELVSNVSGKKPTYVGKPQPFMMEFALKKLGIPREKTIMVGDNYETDIMAGIQSGLDTLHVQTGVTSKEGLVKYAEQPTYSVRTLNEWFSHM
ncbi:TIGR01457 family HAD-type hydrolase [Allobacillus sp. GCM10007491]|uniref:Acid sugar phosphatase n=1 Tax=Allobacillus saliphilus TaxID=2912308 RepID=A0A941CUR4_9BACI|nr:TIGR01457 family HAD-type hydrolase [Allobacillus saliphilus]MBR7553574.1 TIGR01457 family HAD-type hydrolase [Allobacillus saliphilus]